MDYHIRIICDPYKSNYFLIDNTSWNTRRTYPGVGPMVLWSFDDGLVTDMILIDLQKSFDMIKHDIF